MSDQAKPCRNCDGPAEPERQHWATIVCFKCVPPTGSKEVQTAAVIMVCLADSLAVVKARLSGAGPQ